MKWHETKSGDIQGLVVDTETGRNVAVTFDKKDAKLIAAAPELLAACLMALDEPDDYLAIKAIKAAIYIATGE